MTFEDDPLRMVRAARFAAQLDFEVAPEAVEAMTAKADRIEIVSAERVTDELHKLLAAPVPSTGLGLPSESGNLGGWGWAVSRVRWCWVQRTMAWLSMPFILAGLRLHSNTAFRLASALASMYLTKPDTTVRGSASPTSTFST